MDNLKLSNNDPINIELYSFYKATAEYDEAGGYWYVRYPWGNDMVKGDREHVEKVMWEELDLRA